MTDTQELSPEQIEAAARELIADVSEGWDADAKGGTVHLAQSDAAPYGYCPQCGAPGVQRDTTGDDICENAHVYPSKDAVAKPVRLDQAKPEPDTAESPTVDALIDRGLGAALTLSAEARRRIVDAVKKKFEPGTETR